MGPLDTSSPSLYTTSMTLSIDQQWQSLSEEEKKFLLEVYYSRKATKNLTSRGRPPFGFSYDDNLKMVVKNDDYDTLIIIRDMREDECNYSEISVFLNDNGYSSQTGKRWTPQMVRNVFLSFLKRNSHDTLNIRHSHRLVRESCPSHLHCEELR